MLYFILFSESISLILFSIWNPASGNFIIMGGNYNEGSWSCRLIGFFTSTGVDLSRPWAANLYIWSWGQDKGIWRKKRARGQGVPFDFETPRSCFWLASQCLWLERVSLASAHSLSCKEMIWSVIGDVYCSEQTLQELILITSDRSQLEENFSNGTLENAKTALVVSILDRWKSIWTLQVLPAPGCLTPLNW